MDRKFVEREISRIEGFYADEFAKLVKSIDDREPLSDETVNSFSYYLTIQLVRTRFFRDWMISDWRKVGQMILDAFITNKERMPDLPPELEAELPTDLGLKPGDLIVDIQDEAKPEIQSSFMFDPKTLHGFSNTFYNHIWIIGINESSQPFFTSDHPVATVPNKEFGRLGYTGIAAPGIEIGFPITPNYMLILLERTFYEQLQKHDRGYLPIRQKKVNDLNCIQTSNSYRQIYSQSPNFVVAKLFCKNYPEAIKPRFE